MGRKERSGPPDEKVTINLGPVDVGRIDFLVEEGFFQSRTDLIRSAVRQLLEAHKGPIENAVTPDTTGSAAGGSSETTGLGIVMWDRATLEHIRARNQKASARVIGVMRLADDIDPDLADEVIDSIRVYGHVYAPPAARKRL